MDFYHEGQRELQDSFDSRRIADRLEQVTLHDRLTAQDQELIRSCTMFFLATADETGAPDVSYKGGDAGFVEILDEETLAFPHYDGNGMFRSLGNIVVNPKVALLFVDFSAPSRLRIHGDAQVVREGPLLEHWPGAQAAVRVHTTRLFPNCPRYIHRMEIVEPSPYVPQAGEEPPEPEWKGYDVFKDALPGT